MKKKLTVLVTSAMVFSSISFGTAFAFSDVDGSQSAAVNMLQERGIVNGVDADHFAPRGKISYAESVQLLVRAFGYNLDAMRFDHQPHASEFFTNVKDNAWYADAFVIAHYHNLDIPKDVNPNSSVTREQFASLLEHALAQKAQLPLINITPDIKDEASITPDLQGSIARLVHYKIVELDKNGNFNPKGELTRGESATWIYNTLQFMAQVKPPAPPVQTENVSLNVEKVTNDINKVTISREQKPTGGYSIVIRNIQFTDEKHAVIQYTLTDPAADSMNAEVINTPTAVAYLPAGVEVQLEALTTN
ncbi:S-layer homology domain-containing protein [Paenibacillus cremeus]|uniref:Protease complex subunit PrcB family protein n=1 Tax=Paenibacillus cremeus TaxID=2163881 RepID=A0A559KGP1_9BACL|nr:S-layer homology domain-containing protein [Paenibacillus cremeus]TVY11248.1 protease complex subunit PrcB family protein [Paenibacillus cremeus]